ncbi:hypothetical protein PROSTU_01006 [Providencia stuartii ATCC 25827]|uniref:Uncharacterized protein n=1 Tax=Providencia stuartii ATCC 25827 TaxID=471874 RepID=A0AA86YQ95_PROST|nr:hypothetical protein PROSTU_01006 [Providencia stuartii ATCC 25827]
MINEADDRTILGSIAWQSVKTISISGMSTSPKMRQLQLDFLP